MNKNYLIIIICIFLAVVGMYIFLNERELENNNDNTMTQREDLKIEILESGEGEEVRGGETVTVHYVGMLESGELFDSSVGRNMPFTFTVGAGQVIQGWDEGFLGMKVGEKRKLTIPPEMGYGDREIDVIPANSTLIFEIELLEIKRENENVETEDLKIEILESGEGEEVRGGETVTVHYVGRLENGELFDSSVERGTPFSFTVGVGQVIQGWDEGLLGMKVGEKRKLTIPPEMGYGNSPVGPIPANSTLIFEVELLEIK